MSGTYLFYDIETTGINPCFDQILQFAAIRTNSHLEEIDRVEKIIRLNRDIVPHPTALAINRLSENDWQQGESEYKALQEIHRLVNTPGTISLGYNSLAFDNEFLRFSFYRNLLPPYTHQFARGCHRMDIYPMALVYYLFNLDTVVWPIIAGKPSFKLEHINQANGFVSGESHDAMVDVEVTLSLARQLYKKRSVWDYFCALFAKKKEAVAALEKKRGIVVDGQIGADHSFLAPVICLGAHQIYKNQSLWLRLDTVCLKEVAASSIAESTWVIRRKSGETPIILPDEKRFQNKITDERRVLADENDAYLQKHNDLFLAIQHHYQYYTYPVVDGVDVDAALYQMSFPTVEEERLFYEFHQAAPVEKLALIARFSHAVRKEQALRILARHYPAVMDMESQAMFEEYCHRLYQGTVFDFKGKPKYWPTDQRVL